VKGRVVFKGDGTPLPGGMVVFEPVDANNKVSVRGQIQSDGTFRLGTYKDDDGAPEGKYRASVVPPVQYLLERPPPPLFHPRFQDAKTSGLEFTVTRGGNNDFTIEVTKPSRKQ
jgi:hypothetical protein